ncbi:hypothetical protein E4634_05820 [Mangrovimicrobium sediminis]|uniref:Uncharacterized protein n=1 Tax=Mangrovimicrobium sediminis TaxID=2562682 RepID=A0A4Z0M5M6_9GAMM|nr:hypothetical protein [Haliea sp. SAOS-164]TGD74717.1 hypothetical protein E4634_05820 [Haliea sp. SAOS-164]
MQRPTTTRRVLSLLALACALAAGTAQAQQAPRHNQWYLATSISVFDAVAGKSYSAPNRALIGQLVDASDDCDRFDLAAFSASNGARAAVVFERPACGGELVSDYHARKGRRGEWEMTVYSTVAGGAVTLSWDSFHALKRSARGGEVSYRETPTRNSQTLQNLHLVDLETLEVIDALGADGRPNSYTFTLDGQTRRDFRWVLGNVKSRAFKPIVRAASASAAVGSTRAVAPTAAGKFGLPPAAN